MRLDLGAEDRVQRFAARTVGFTLFATLSLGALSPHLVLAGGADATSASSAHAATAGLPLPDLPKLPPILHPEPDPQALKDLERLLERLTSEDASSRNNARRAIDEVEPSIVPAIARRIQEVRASLDRESATRLLEDARKAGRSSLKKPARDDAKAEAADPKHKRGKGHDDDDGDWLDFLLAKPKPKDKTWRDLVELTGMDRMLAAVGTTPAVRQLIAHYAFFGDLVRVDIQRLIGTLRDRAVPALIEARQHDAKNVQRWANRRLDLLGRAIAGEAVATSDARVVADVLRAYGRTRDVEAVRVVLSFCDSEHSGLREAAREAVAAVGEPAMWQLRDVYLGMTGGKAPRDWTWDRLARELFGLYDRARQTEVRDLMEEGLAAARDRKWTEATQAYDRVLARTPLFDRRKEMVPAYLQRAREIEAKDGEAALAMLRKALRLDPKNELARATEAEIDVLEASLLAERGTPERRLLTRALELDPKNDRARAALAVLAQKASPRETDRRRYGAASAIGLVALLAMALLARRRNTAGPPPAAEPPATGPAEPPG